MPEQFSGWHDEFVVHHPRQHLYVPHVARAAVKRQVDDTVYAMSDTHGGPPGWTGWPSADLRPQHPEPRGTPAWPVRCCRAAFR